MLRKVSDSKLAVMSAMLDDPAGERYGLDLAGETGLKSGVLYPALHALEEDGILASRQEEIDPRAARRPRRRLYRFTATGESVARDAVVAHLVRVTPKTWQGRPHLRPREQPA